MSRQDFRSRGTVPFAMGEVLGFRSFIIGSSGALLSLNGNHTWREGEQQARHDSSIGLFTSGYRTCPIVAASGCTCGFYAYLDGAYHEFGTPSRAFGVIKGYGRVTYGRGGFRCSKAKLAALYLPYGGSGKAEKLKWHHHLQRWTSFAFPRSLYVVAVVISLILIRLLLNINEVGWYEDLQPWESIGFWSLYIAWLTTSLANTSIRIRRFKTRLNRQNGADSKRSPFGFWLPNQNGGTAKEELIENEKRRSLEDWNLSEFEIGDSLSKAECLKIKHRYPGVPIYSDPVAMLRDFPPTRYQDLNG